MTITLKFLFLTLATALLLCGDILNVTGRTTGKVEKVSKLVVGTGSLLFNVTSLNVVGTAPQDNPDNIRFYLFPNSSEPNQKQEIVYQNISTLNGLLIRPTSQWKFIVHGFIQNLDSGFPQSVKNAYLKRMRTTGESWNVVIVDWGELAYDSESGLGELGLGNLGLPLYDRAVRNVAPTGNRLAALISFLIANKVINSLQQVHLIGQSLGAHVVGQAGLTLQTLCKSKVPRITGLDPAGPLYYTGIAGRPLETSDGEFVDVYHCNPGAFGIDRSIGDVEFYVNIPYIGESIQPQCEQLRPNEAEDPNLCSHNYCPKFFASAILRNITAQKCDGRVVVGSSLVCGNETVLYGEDVSYQATGQYFANITENLDDPALFI